MKAGQRSHWAKVESLLDAALDRPPGERFEFVAQATPDSSVRREVKSLLDTAERLDDFLSRPLQLGFQELDAPSLVGRRIGPWKLLRLLGQGGMGTVYLAERADGAFEQRVAIKLMPEALLHRDLQRRFRIEQQALGRLEHQSIARILDGGVTPEGLPYLVMERVEGEPIDAYCERQRLGIAARIRLLLGVCEAVRYAHGRLVVHRDLKPANILVIPPGRVKLLDFGIAKLLTDDPDARTITKLQPFTPQYAAPEQLSGDPITTVTDVYGIGGLAYRLLTGRPPWPLEDSAWVHRLKDEGRHEPELPSRVTRHAEWRRKLRGDLDAIVMKALSADPRQRYASVEELASDLECFLESKPIVARSQPASTRARKFVRRHRTGVAAALLAALSVGVLLTMLAWRARVAERGRQRAQEVSDFFTELLTSTNPDYARGAEVPVADLLERSVGLAQSKLANQPRLQADILDVLGSSLMRIGHQSEALDVRQRAVNLRRGTVDAGSKKMLTSLLATVESLSYVDAPTTADRAGQLLAESRRLARRLGGDESVEMATVLYADALFRMRHYPPASREYGKAESRLRQAQQMLEGRGKQNAIYADVLHSLAGFADSQAEGERLIRRALAINRRLFADDALPVVSVRNDLALVLDSEGKHEEAERLLRDVLSVYRKTYGTDHPQTMAVENNLAAVLRDERKFGAAEPLYREVLDYRLRILPPQSPGTAFTLYGLGRVLLGQGKLQDAAGYLERAKHALEATDSPLAKVADSWLAECRIRQGHVDEARTMLNKDLEFAEGYWGPDGGWTKDIRSRLADLPTSPAPSL